MTNWEEIFEKEIARGEQARRDGNEGMARVCARRAAGLAAGEYLRQNDVTEHSPSAYDQLRTLCDLPRLHPRARAAAERLLLRVTMEHTLPVEGDLLADARLLKAQLLGK
jgi:hypothetical protein